MNKFGAVLGLAAVLALGACETMKAPAIAGSSEPAYPQSTNSGDIYAGYGEVQSIDPVGQVNAGVGATGPIAYAGHEPERRSQQSNAHKLTIRMDYGPYQTLTQSTSADFRVGDRVQIENGVARRY